MKLCAALFALTLARLAAAGPGPGTRPPVGARAEIDRVVATVAEAPIWQSELDERVQSIDEAIDDEVVIGHVDANYVNVSTSELDSAVATLAKQNNVDDAGLDALLASRRVTRATLRDAIKRELLVFKTLRLALGDKVAVTPQGDPARRKWISAQRELVHIAVAPTPAPAGHAVDWTVLVGPIRAVEISGATAPARTAAHDILAVEIGTVLDRARLRGELARVLELPEMAAVAVSGSQRSDGIALSVALSPQPVLHAFAVREVGSASDPALSASSIVTGRPLDPSLLDTLTNGLRDSYFDRGYRNAHAKWTLAAVAAGQVDATVELDPGQPFVVDAIELKGNVQAPRAALLKALDSNVTAGGPWRDDHVDRAKVLLMAYYFDHGFVKVDVDVEDPTGPHGKLVFDITEGSQYRLGAITFPGASEADAKRYLELVGLHPRDVFSRTAIIDGAIRVRDAAHAVNATPSTIVDEAHHLIDVQIELQAH